MSGLAVLVGSTALGGVVQLGTGACAAPWLVAALLPTLSSVTFVRVLRAVPAAGRPRRE